MEPEDSRAEFWRIVEVHSTLSTHFRANEEILDSRECNSYDGPTEQLIPEPQQDSSEHSTCLSEIVVPSIHWFVLQHCFLWVRALSMGEASIADALHAQLVEWARRSVFFAFKVRSLLRLISGFSEKIDTLPCEEDDSHFTADGSDVTSRIGELSSTISAAIDLDIQRSQTCFYGNLGCIAVYLVNALNANDLTACTRANLSKMLMGMNVLLASWTKSTVKGLQASPITLFEPSKRILNVMVEDSQIFPTRSSCPFTLLLEVSDCTTRTEFLAQPDESIQEPGSDSFLDSLFGPSWLSRKAQMRRNSAFSASPGWDCETVLVKGADGVLQESFACQLIGTIARIWKEACIPMRVHPYAISPLDDQLAIVEFIHDAKTVDFLKRKTRPLNGSTIFFKEMFDETRFADESAQDNASANVSFAEFHENFISSCAAYSVINYVLQISDRHNKNVLIKRDGSIVHIDFGYILELTPGGIGVESLVPFKLPAEYTELMGEKGFDRFRELVLLGMTILRQNIERVAALIEIGNHHCLPCLGGSSKAAAQRVRERVLFNVPEPHFSQEVNAMIDASMGHWITRSYDFFQKFQNGIEN